MNVLVPKSVERHHSNAEQSPHPIQGIESQLNVKFMMEFAKNECLFCKCLISLFFYRDSNTEQASAGSQAASIVTE